MNLPHTIVENSRSRKGLTLVEILVVIAIMGIMALVVIPAVGGVMDGAEDNNAKAYASALKAGKQTYRMRVSNAATLYAAASDDNARYVLIQPYLDGGAAPASLSAFVGTGYSATMGATLNAAVTVTSPSGNSFSSN